MVASGLTVGTRLPAYVTSHGRVQLAARTDEEIEAYLSRVRLDPRTAQTVTDPGRLRELLLEVRAQGWPSWTRSSRKASRPSPSRCATRSGAVIASVNVGTHSRRLPPAALKEIAAGTAAGDRAAGRAGHRPAGRPAPSPSRSDLRRPSGYPSRAGPVKSCCACCWAQRRSTLPGRRALRSRDDRDAARPLVARQPPADGDRPAPRPSARAPGSRDHQRGHLAPPSVVGHADDDGLGHPRVRRPAPARPPRRTPSRRRC